MQAQKCWRLGAKSPHYNARLGFVAPPMRTVTGNQKSEASVDPPSDEVYTLAIVCTFGTAEGEANNQLQARMHMLARLSAPSQAATAFPIGR